MRNDDLYPKQVYHDIHKPARSLLAACRDYDAATVSAWDLSADQKLRRHHLVVKLMAYDAWLLAARLSAELNGVVALNQQSRVA